MSLFSKKVECSFNLYWTEILLNKSICLLRRIRKIAPRNVLEYWLYVKAVSFVKIPSMLGWCVSVNRKCKHFLPFICFPLCHNSIEHHEVNHSFLCQSALETLYSSLVCLLSELPMAPSRSLFHKITCNGL